jgi:hypothetical protein
MRGLSLALHLRGPCWSTPSQVRPWGFAGTGLCQRLLPACLRACLPACAPACLPTMAVMQGSMLSRKRTRAWAIVFMLHQILDRLPAQA